VQAIVDVIGSGKTEGCATYGGTGGVSGTYTDPVSMYPYTINYNVPVSVTIVASVSIKAGIGYNSTIGNQIVLAVVNAINALLIGDDVLYTRLYAPALLVGPYAHPNQPTDGSTYELLSVRIAISPGSPVAADIPIAFNQVARTTTSSVALVVT